MKFIYVVLGLAFVGFGGLVYLLAKDMTFAAYAHSFILAFVTNLVWQNQYG